MKYSIATFLLLMGNPFLLSQEGYSEFIAPRLKAETVAFCDLLKRPNLYGQKMVRIQAIYRYGGEDTADLYCPECLDAGTVKPIFTSSYESCTKPKVAETFSLKKHSSGTVIVNLVGKFTGQGEAYTSTFYIECVEQAKYITKDFVFPDRLSRNISLKIHCKLPPESSISQKRQRK